MEIYIARPGDSLGSAARRFGLPEGELAALNQLGDPRRLTAGLALLIPSPASAPAEPRELGACLSETAPDSLLRELLPELSFYCPLCLSLTEDGGLAPPRSPRRKYPADTAAPLLGAANIAKGAFSASLARGVLGPAEGRERFLAAALAEIEAGGFRGLFLKFCYLYPFDRKKYSDFLAFLSRELHSRGLYLFTALAPREEERCESLLCAAHDYEAHGRYADRSVLLAYDWGYECGAPQAVSPVNRLRRVLDYAAGKIPPGKLLLGFSGYGYNWALPWRQGQRALPILHTAAANLAVSLGVEVRFDPAFRASYFIYTDSASRRHIVWFEDARSVQAKLELVEEYGLAGLCRCDGSRLCRAELALICARFSPALLP